MSEDIELSISELRRKKRADVSHSTNGSHGDVKTSIAEVNGTEEENFSEETWIQPEPRLRVREPETARRRTLPFPEKSQVDDDEAISLPFDPVRILDALKRNWFWCLLAGLVFGGLGLSWFWLGAKSKVQVQLVRRETPGLFQSNPEEGDGFHPQKYTDDALVSLMQSPEMVRRVAEKAQGSITPDELARSLAIFSEREAELVNIVFNGKVPPQKAADLANLYANEVINFTKELQGREARDIAAYLGEKLEAVNSELAEVNAEINKLPLESRVVDTDKQTEAYMMQLADLETKYQLLQIDLQANNPIQDKLQVARDELAEMLTKYTDEHPFVQRQREKIKALELQAAAYAKNPNTGKNLDELRADNVHMVSSSEQKQSLSKQAEQMKLLMDNLRAKLSGLSEKDVNFAMQQKRFESLRKFRDNLANRQREAALFEQNSLGYYTLLAPATAERVFTKGHIKKTLAFTLLGAMFGIFSVAGLVAVREVMDDRLKTVADVERATELPVLATLGDLKNMSAAEQSAWAFRTWTILKGKLSASQSQGLVCGIISAEHGEGRSTWINLLVNTANQRGLRVLTISTKPSGEPGVHPHEPTDNNENEGDGNVKELQKFEDSVLATPAQLSKQLNDPENTYPVVHIPLPGWVWNLERRKQWQNALSHWRKIENLVLLVELPPASEPESVLLAEKLPQVVWMTDSGKVSLRKTREHLETLRHAGCNVVGALLNRQPHSFWRNQMARWFGIVAVLVGLNFVIAPAQAEETNVNQPAGVQTTNRSFTVSSSERAPWQKRLTLGPGDVLNLGFFGETNLTKNEITIGPDGRISYLQATDVMAAGLTIDELRTRLDKELSKYYRSPRTMVSPVLFKSKKYYVLGKVVTKGVFTLERPMTVLEALARANGVETGLLNRNSIDLADLQRSFLVRNGERIPIDFERLFNQGDLSQNIAIQPEDFLYFPPMNLQEVYVIGEVVAPGVVSYNSRTTLISALAERGGFNPKAYKSRVLVIRGSLNHPETFVVNTHDIVDGKMVDFKLQPKDIIYVSFRPFIRAEELLDLAATGFIQSAITAWAGQYVGPFITKPFFHGIYNND